MRRSAPPGATFRGGVLLVASVALILRATLGTGFSIAPMRIPAAWCLICGDGWLMDAVSNVVLFLPLGVALAQLRLRVGYAAGLSALLSLTVESLQAAGIPALRSPSAADVVTNTVGGLVAAWLTGHAATLWEPDQRLTRRLLLAWMGVVTGCLILTTVALQPIPTSGASSDPTVRPSPWEYAPGYGWFGGQLRGARIDDVPFPDRSSGPVVAEVPAIPDRITVDVMLTGYDTLAYQRAMVFLHPTGDTIPVALLSQQGRDVRWERRTRGSAWGLARPGIRLQNVAPFSRLADASPLTLHADASRAKLTLSTTTSANGPHLSVQSRLTPLLGWALLQSVVRPSDPGAAAVQLAWIFVLVVPLARWGRLLGWRWVTAGMGVVGGNLMGGALIGGLGVPPPVDWAMLLLAFGVGCLPWRRSLRSAASSRYIAG